MSDMRAGPSAPPSPGSWQFESVREQRGIWIGKSPCMFLGRNEAKGAEGNILQVLRPLGKWVFTEREESWSVLLLGVKAGENGPSSSWGKVRGRWRVAARSMYPVGCALLVQQVEQQGFSLCQALLRVKGMWAHKGSLQKGNKLPWGRNARLTDYRSKSKSAFSASLPSSHGQSLPTERVGSSAQKMSSCWQGPVTQQYFLLSLCVQSSCRKHRRSECPALISTVWHRQSCLI